MGKSLDFCLKNKKNVLYIHLQYLNDNIGWIFDFFQ